MAELGDIARNERLKLTAALLNNLSVSFITVGVIGPALSLLSGSPAVTSNQFLAIACGCIGLGLTLHLMGRRLLEGLR
ncbi:hypothetical protein [Rhodopseudomonas parapalustris]